MNSRKRVYRCDAGWGGVRCHRAARINQWGDAGLVERRLCLECFARLTMRETLRFWFIEEAPE